MNPACFNLARPFLIDRWSPGVPEKFTGGNRLSGG
jgi:hypothetical protein